MSINNKKIAVVIPAYNEQELITKTIIAIPTYVDCILVIDDCSTDQTVNIVEKLKVERLYLLKHDKNYGVGKAIVTGYKYALTLRCDLVAVMGADAQMDPLDLEAILLPVLSGEANYSKGNRFINRANYSKMPKLRILGNVLFSILSCIASGYYHIFDTQCGFTAVDSKMLSQMDLDSLFPGYGFPTDMLVKLKKHSAIVVDVPIKAIYADEKSGIRIFPYTLTIIWLTMFLFIQRQYSKVRKKFSLAVES